MLRLDQQIERRQPSIGGFVRQDDGFRWSGQDAGVDMTTSQPFEAAMREMNRIMDEMERIYARGGSTGG